MKMKMKAYGTKMKMKPCGTKMKSKMKKKMKMKPCGRNIAAAALPVPKGLPMLVIPADLPHERFYSIFEGKFYDNINIQLPIPSSTYSKSGIAETAIYSEIEDAWYFVACGHGWIALLIEEEEPDVAVMYLVNPFRKDQVPILLPPVDGIPAFANIKVIMSADPASNPDNFVVITLSVDDSMFSFIKGGQKEWTLLESRGESLFSDAIFYRGQVYVVDPHSGMIVSFNVESFEPGMHSLFDLESSSSSIIRHKAIPPTNDMFRSSVRAYLVESTNGDLLHVRRFLIIKRGCWEVVESFFMVYKLVFDADGSIAQQVEVKSIGDEALFVGEYSPSMSVLASRYPGCQPNSIYYADETEPALRLMKKRQEEFRYHMAGVFSLEDGTSTQLYSRKYYLPETPPGPAVWLTQPV